MLSPSTECVLKEGAVGNLVIVEENVEPAESLGQTSKALRA